MFTLVLVYFNIEKRKYEIHIEKNRDIVKLKERAIYLNNGLKGTWDIRSNIGSYPSLIGS